LENKFSGSQFYY